MLLNAAKAKRQWNAFKQREIGRDTLQYHLLLVGALFLAALRLNGGESLWLIAAYLPALARAFRGWANLTPELPSLKRVGIQETILSIWFIGCLLALTFRWHP